jgi:hypothetical protein
MTAETESRISLKGNNLDKLMISMMIAAMVHLAIVLMKAAGMIDPKADVLRLQANTIRPVIVKETATAVALALLHTHHSLTHLTIPKTVIDTTIETKKSTIRVVINIEEIEGADRQGVDHHGTNQQQN